MPDFEAIGDAATGGLVARAVEPGAGEAADGHTHEKNCLNCGCELVGDYCHCCGQQAHVHRTVGAWWHDFLHSVVHLDGKFWRTLPMLAIRPGDLTRRYIDGERARFVSPLALFLFSVFLMFAVFSLLGSPMDFSSEDAAQVRRESQADFQAEQAKSRQELAGLRSELEQAREQQRPTGGIEGEMRGVRTEMAARERAFAVTERIASETERSNGAKGGQAGREPEVNILTETGWPPLDRAIAKAEGNPSLLLYKLQTNAYKFSWALIPISLPFVWLMFLHRRRYRRDYGAYDHLVFVTYSIAFMSLGAILATLLGTFGVNDALIWTAIAFMPPIHMYLQLRGAYRLSRWSALWRTVLLVNFTFVALGFFLTLLIVLGVFG